MLESKKRAFIFLLLAFILASTAGYLVWQKVKDLNADLGGMTKIYIANGDIPARTLIEKNQLTTMEVPNKFVNSSYVTSQKDLLGMVVVVPLNKNDVITKNMIKPYSNLREENHRLVAMYPSEKIQFDQVIEALDRVDIIISTKENNKPKTEIFMRDVPVAYASVEKKQFAGVALEVSIEDASKLIHIQNYADKVRVLKANVGKEDSEDPNAKVEITDSTTNIPPKTNPTQNQNTQKNQSSAEANTQPKAKIPQNNTSTK